MRRTFYFLLLGFGLAGGTTDTPAGALSLSEWQRELAAKPQGDGTRGGTLYAEHGCAGCHGPEGMADNRQWPVLARQRPLYLYKMLLDYQAERMAGPDAAIMASVVRELNRQDLADLAEWLGALPRPQAAEVPEPAILRGDRKRLIPPCSACHGAHGQGWDLQPALRGQNRDYLIRTLQRFKKGERSNDVNAGMSQFAAKLTDEEIRALAEYYGR
ncbi:cytochrome c family protein [Methylococcus capsulatus str. Bath]|jgi:cytochrome c553|uniref:Cytochrome c family protein n=2 Tax=Methylococcus capsulatus TaxID=414 RepID=Q609P7_METCA|nr:c-type cytochrome [Methylococcus capsulatus]AAU92754.1 cytochrome c family protein [Methylococcus capsulatus str. Bath]CAI8721737.1 Cytochrome c family protein [Methylococcus capsulatus]